MKKILTIIVSLFSLLLCFSCDRTEECDVVTSFYAINELTEALTKDTSIKVHSLIDSTCEPHEFSPSTKDVALLTKAKLIIFNGNDLEEFEESLSDSIKDKIVFASKDVTPVEIDEKETGDNHEHHDYDPHTFVSVKSNIIMLNTIKDSLINIFENEKDKINENYDLFKNELVELDNKYTNAFKNIDYPLVTGHNAYSYVARDYNVLFKPVRGLHEEEISEKGLAAMINYIKDNNIKTIYGEYFEENDTIESIAQQTNSTLKLLYTGERMGEEHLTLIQMHEQNIKTLTE